MSLKLHKLFMSMTDFTQIDTPQIKNNQCFYRCYEKCKDFICSFFSTKFKKD